MLVSKFQFKPPVSEETRLIQKLQKVSIGQNDAQDEESEEDDDDDLPVIVDPNEEFIKF